MTAYLLAAAAVTLGLVLVMRLTHREVEVTPAGILWLIIWGLVIPVGLYFLVVLALGPPPDDPDDENHDQDQAGRCFQ